ncbi:MAG: zinc ribbon domain-containing protein [Candidatus Obscuribacterales bacterium]|nr:zinc ribbon domain-containing protein [Candidatus Obscuribacterales bacterium]
MSFDAFQNERKSILTVWILNLLLPGVGLGTMYAAGASCLPILMGAWVYQLVSMNLQVAIQCYVFLSVAGTIAAIHHNEKYAERQQRALDLLQSKNDQSAESEQLVDAQQTEVHALDTLERKVRQAEQILARRQDEDSLEESSSLVLPKSSEIQASWVDLNNANTLKGAGEREDGYLSDPLRQSPINVPSRFANGFLKTPSLDSAETPHALSGDGTDMALSKDAKIAVSGLDVAASGLDVFSSNDTTKSIDAITGRSDSAVEKGPSTAQPEPPLTQVPAMETTQPAAYGFGTIDVHEPVEVSFATQAQPPAPPAQPRPPLQIPPPALEPVAPSHSPAPLWAESLDLVTSEKSDLPSSPPATEPPANATESQVQGFMQTLGDSVGTSYQQTPYPQPSFDFSYQRFEAPNFTFDFTGALEEPQSTSSSQKQNNAKGDCPNCKSPKQPEFSFCLRCGVSF